MNSDEANRGSVHLGPDGEDVELIRRRHVSDSASAAQKAAPSASDAACSRA